MPAFLTLLYTNLSICFVGVNQILTEIISGSRYQIPKHSAWLGWSVSSIFANVILSGHTCDR
ncbi:hypothetical protein F5141DRAFT_769426 [Pisolithus sp. B1]|nr:hypothetical protein F5141DRAFT_769426 [Pisolithus sp. B1]